MIKDYLNKFTDIYNSMLNWKDNNRKKNGSRGLKIAISGLALISVFYGANACSDENKPTPKIDISKTIGVNNNYEARVFSELGDTIITIENKYDKSILIGRGLTSHKYLLEITGEGIQDDELLKEYASRNKLVHLRNSIIEDKYENLENKLNFEEI